MNYNISDDTKCPICFEIPRKEIFQCRNGHTVCDDCSKTLLTCPQCRVTFEQNKIRNRALENMLDKMTFDCPFKYKGCTEMLKRNEISSHSEICSFGTTGTKFCHQLGYSCGYLFNPSELHEALLHFQDKHNFIICRNNVANLCIEGLQNYKTKGFYTPVLFDLQSTENIVWILLAVLNKKAKTISPVCIQLSEITSETANFRAEFEIKVVNDALKAPDIVWNTPLVPFKNTKFALKYQMMPLALDTLSSFYMKDSVLSMKVSTIQNKLIPTTKGAIETFHILNIPDVQIRANLPVFASTSQFDNDIPNENYNYSAYAGSTQTYMQNMQIGQTHFLSSRSRIFNDITEENIEIYSFFCDICRRTQLQPPHYKCLECENYDICFDCVKKEKYHHHVFALMQDMLQYNRLLKTTSVAKYKLNSGQVVKLPTDAMRPFYDPKVTMSVMASILQRPQTTKCNICQLSDCTYICLECEVIFGHCGSEHCSAVNLASHPKEHVFAWSRTASHRHLIIGHHNLWQRR